MCSEFIYKYYIDPIRYGQAYTMVDTLTYAGILIISVWLVYAWLRKAGVRIDRDLILCTLPYVVLGGLLRVVEDTGMVHSDARYLLITPLIYGVVFFYAASLLILSRYAGSLGRIRSYRRVYGLVGVVSCAAVLAVLAAYGLTTTCIDLGVLITILAMAVLASGAVLVFLRQVFHWRFVSDPLYISLIFGHMLDASATGYGIDLHPVHYVEQHVVGSHLIALTGTAFSMFILKLAILIPAVYILERYRREGNPDLWHLVVLAMITVGLAPGVRDLVRMVLHV